MGSNELRGKIYELRELRRMADEISAEIETLQDAIKAHMDDSGVDTIAGTDYKVTYKSVTTSRFDSAAFRKDNPEIASAYMKTTTTRRFTVA